MDQLAYAAVMAIEYLKMRNDDDYEVEDDKGILEELIYALQNGTPEEKRAIRNAAERLGEEEEERASPDPERRSDYENFVDRYGLDDDEDD